MKLRSALLAAAVLALPVAAKAQPIAGMYIGLGAGMNFLQDEIVKPNTTLESPKLKAVFVNPGIAGIGSVGFGFGNGLRLEVEGNYNYNHLHKLEGTPFPTNAGGDNDEYGVMVNALYDFDIGLPFVFPYLGAGAGYEWTRWSGVHAYGTNFPAALHVGGSSSDGNFAYQGIAGLSFPVVWMPGLSFTADYRFLGTTGDNRFDATVTTRFPTTSVSSKIKVNNEFAHQVIFGIRYAFGVVPPPPPPAPAPVAAPAPAPARTYLVFFDWDRADLTDRARQIIGEAAEASRHVQYTRIEVNGYTDRSGTPQYNVRLSIRRANNVAAELVRDGVPRNVIDIHGYGETHPLVPTAPGVREPQNRRVEIILH